MPFLAGLLTTLVGAAALAAYRATDGALQNLEYVSAELIWSDVQYWFVYGAAFLLLITLVILPLTYVVLRRLGRVALLPLVIAGAIGALLVMVLEISAGLIYVRSADYEPMLRASYGGLRLALGMVAGLAFAYIMQWLRPADFGATRLTA